MSVDKIRRGGYSYEPEGAGRVNEPKDSSDRSVEPAGEASKAPRAQDEYVHERKKGKPDPKFQTYDRRGQLMQEEPAEQNITDEEEPEDE